MKYILLIYVKMPTIVGILALLEIVDILTLLEIVGILTFTSRTNK